MTPTSQPATKGVTEEMIRDLMLLMESYTAYAGDAIPASLLLRSQDMHARLASLSLPPPGEGEAQPATWQWRALEDGEPRTAWKDPELGDRPGWEALAKRNPEKYATERRALYSVPISPAAPELAVKDGWVQCGWAYQDKRWDDDRWHVCGFDSKPRAHEGRLVRPIYVEAALSSVRES